jgi:hypothetical protein
MGAVTGSEEGSGAGAATTIITHGRYTIRATRQQGSGRDTLIQY